MLWFWIVSIALADPGVLPPPADPTIYLTGSSALFLFIIGLACGLFLRFKIAKTAKEVQDELKLRYLQQLTTTLTTENRDLRGLISRTTVEVPLSKDMALFIVKACHPDRNPKETEMAAKVTKWALVQKKQATR